MTGHNLEQDYYCQNCDAEWDYEPNDQRCPYCDSSNFHCYPKPKFKPQQWVKYKPLGPLYTSKNKQIAEIRRDGKGGWLYVLPKRLDPDGYEVTEFPEDALEPGKYESRSRRLWKG